jgi:hypothetical protein
MSVGFHLLTKGATLNIFPDECAHSGSPVVMLD